MKTILGAKCQLRAISIIVSAVILIAMTPVSVTIASDWVKLGPEPITSGPYTGRCSAIATSRTNPDLYYVGGASGGVWKTINGGNSWTPLTDHLPINAIGALAMDPSNESIVYAGSGEANFANHSFYGVGLYKTTDGGATWNVLAQDTFGGRTFSRLIVSHENSQILFASLMEAGGFPAKNAAKGHPGKDGAVGVYKSTDGGHSWTLLTNGIPATAASDLCMDSTNANIVYAAMGDIFGPSENGIYKTTNSGVSWTKLSGGSLPQSNNGRITLGLSPSNPQRIYAMITNPATSTGGDASTKGVYRSDDAGATWITRSPGNIQASYGWYLATMIVHPQDPDMVFAGGLELVRSSNGGSNWVDVTPPHVDLHRLAFDSSNRLLSADDGGCHRSANNGTSWASLNNNLGVIQFYAGLSVHPTNATFILGGTQDNGTNRRDGTLAWSTLLGGDGGYTAIHPSNPQTMFAEYQGTGNLYYSTNGGGYFSWRGSGINSSDRNCFLPPMVYDPGNSSTVLYATHRIYKSTNNGGSWNAISGDLTGGSPAAIRALVMAPSNGQTVYAATNDGRFLVSLDGGSNWDLKLENLPGGPRVTREIAVHPHNDGIAYLAVSQFGVDQIRKTTNFGDTWSVIDGNFPDQPANTVAVHVLNDSQFVFVGTDNGVYMSGAIETNWQLYGNGMPHSPVVDLIVDTEHDRLVAGSMGRGAWSIELPQEQACLHTGDPNFDGFATAGDAQMAFQIALGAYTPTETEFCAADCNADDDVTAGDAQQIFLFALGSGECMDPLLIPNRM